MTQQRSESRIQAEKKYNEKRKSQPRMPSFYLSEEEAELFGRVMTHYSVKKDAIMDGLRLLDKKLKKPGSGAGKDTHTPAE